MSRTWLIEHGIPSCDCHAMGFQSFDSEPLPCFRFYVQPMSLATAMVMTIWIFVVNHSLFFCINHLVSAEARPHGTPLQPLPWHSAAYAAVHLAHQTSQRATMTRTAITTESNERYIDLLMVLTVCCLLFVVLKMHGQTTNNDDLNPGANSIPLAKGHIQRKTASENHT